MRTQVVHRLEDLVLGLAETQHQAGLGQPIRAVTLGVRQHTQRLLVARAGIAHRMGEPTHRLDVLREDLEPGVDHGLDVGRDALEIRDQGLDRGLRHQVLDGPHRGGEMRRAAVRQVVAVDGGQHDIAQTHQLHGARGVARLLGVEPAAWVAGVHRAETAGTGADLAHQHQRRGAGVPALADVRALGLFTDRRKAMLAHGAAHGFVVRAAGERRLEPARLAAGHTHRRCGGGLDAVADRREPLRGAVLLAAGGLPARRLLVHDAKSTRTGCTRTDQPSAPPASRSSRSRNRSGVPTSDQSPW